MIPDKNMRILVVDDSAVMRKIIANFLKKIGLRRIIEANNGAVALEMLGDHDVDLVLSDWCMPVMCGNDLLKNIRENSQTRNLPFIMISAEAQPHLLQEAYDRKVDYYIVKPFTIDNLVHAINKVTG